MNSEKVWLICFANFLLSCNFVLRAQNHKGKATPSPYDFEEILPMKYPSNSTNSTAQAVRKTADKAKRSACAGSESPMLHQKKALAYASAFFNEIRSLRNE